MTLTQLSAFVLVARLGSVTAAANVLGVSEPAVSQALSALRSHLGDPLLIRQGEEMTLTPGGSRLLPIAAQIVALGSDAAGAVRAAQGAPEQLRLAVTSTIAEFVVNPLIAAFGRRAGTGFATSSGVAATAEIPVLLSNRLADVALGPRVGGEHGPELVSEPIFQGRLLVVGAARARPPGGPARWHWLVDPSGTDPGSEASALLHRLGVPDSAIEVCPNQTAAWSAATAGAGVAIAVEHLVSQRLRRQELHVIPTPVTPMPVRWHVTTLRPDRCGLGATALRHFLGTPTAMHVMRSPGAGVPPSRFRPPVYVTIWSDSTGS